MFVACSENEAGHTVFEPVIHDDIEIDVDEDGILDFTITYSSVYIESLSIEDGTQGISGNIRPAGRNEILRHADKNSLFLRDLDEIEDVVFDPLKWRSTFSRTIVFIATLNAEGDWPSFWDIYADEAHAAYFLGLKLVSDVDSQLAWLEIEVNDLDGSISIVDKGIR